MPMQKRKCIAIRKALALSQNSALGLNAKPGACFG